MSKANSTSKRPRKPARKPLGPKPEKPAGSPLTVNPCGYYSKKIRGKVYYFGSWADGYDAALAKWNEQKDDLEAGRTPKADLPAMAGTVKELLNHYLNHKRRAAEDGDITWRTLEDCKAICTFIAKHIDRARLVADLNADDFTHLRKKLLAQHRDDKAKSLTVLGNQIGRIKQVFNFGVKDGKIARAPVYGAAFVKPAASKVAKQKQQEVDEEGERTFTREEILAMLLFASGPLESMILLAANAGLGNSDLGQLRMTHLDLERGWLDYPRPKTAQKRKAWLWPETVAAIKDWLAIRPAPKDPAHDRLVFITKPGLPWHKAKTAENPLSSEFKKLTDSIGINGGRNFYTLRRTFRTQAGEAKDPEAACFAMGHTLGGMSAVYVKGVSEERLQAVAETVRRWLFAIR